MYIIIVSNCTKTIDPYDNTIFAAICADDHWRHCHDILKFTLRDNPTISTEDFRDIFQNTREFTSSSPSGVHIGHYKVAIKDDFLSEIHTAFMSLPFHYSFT